MGYFAIAFAVLVTYYITSSIAAWHRLRHFKGPFLGSFSYLWMAKTAVSGKSWKIHLENSQKYGSPFVRIGPDVLITDSAEVIRRINAARSPYKRDDWYDAFQTNPYSRSMVSTTDEDQHNYLKTRTAAGYSGKDVPSMESDLAGQIANFKDYLRSKYLSTDAKTKPVDFSKAVQYYALDVITKIGFGNEWGFLASDSDVDSFVASFIKMTPFMSLCCDVPWARRIFANKLMLKLVGPKETDKFGFGKMMG